jgi:tetratricopeptide (TPR) repeat protein
VPYEALDGIIESLSTYLRARPLAQATALVPPEAGCLARLFPAMLQVKAVARAARSEPEDPEPSAQRDLAFSALRELLTRIAERHALVLFIDDLHWADADSLRLLEALLRPPDPPPLLMLACLRTEEIASKPFLQTFLEGAGAPSRTALLLGPMTETETWDVMASMLPTEARITAAERLALSRESGGNPFLVEQLTHFAAAHDGSEARSATLGDMLRHRLYDSPDGARRFLEVLAVCGRPMAPQVVYEAAGLAGDERPLVAILCADHLLRHSGSAARIETYHDRMRETLAAQLSPDETRSIHGALARTLTARGFDDPEALFEHCRGAGDRHGAARQAARAATRASAVLAFDRAAFFYRNALELAPHDQAATGWKQGLAEALTNAGRPPEAAPVYLEAASGAHGWQRIELQRRAAEQFLVGGHIDEGLDVIRTVLRALHMRLAPSPSAALASLVWRRIRIRWRGLAFVARDPDEVPADRLLRIDTCWSVATGLALVDQVRAADFNTRHLLLALEAGEPYRVARAMALEAGFLTCSGDFQMAAECAERAAGLARQSGHPHAEALSALSAGMSALLSGEWKNASRLCERALVVLREDCSGATWEINCAEIFLLGALLFQGDVHEVSRRLPPLLAGAADRGNRFFETELRTRMNLVWLAADRPDEGERHAIEVMEGWSHEGFHGQHYSQVLARIQTELYRGDAEAAWRLTGDTWPALTRTLLLHIQFVRIEASYLRARAALLNAARGRDVGRFLSIARGDARRIGRVGLRWSEAIALLLNAAVTYLEGRAGAARELLAMAVTAFERADMGSHAAAARRRLGRLQDDESGRGLVADADAWMAAHGIRNPARMTRMLAPGFPDPEDA